MEMHLVTHACGGELRKILDRYPGLGSIGCLSGRHEPDREHTPPERTREYAVLDLRSIGQITEVMDTIAEMDPSINSVMIAKGYCRSRLDEYTLVVAD